MISCSSTSRLAEYMVFVGLLFFSPPPLTSRPSALPHSLSLERAVVGSQHGAMGDKDFPDYATREVPLPLFGLGHDRACTSPTVGKPDFVRCLHPNSAFAMAPLNFFLFFLSFFFFSIFNPSKPCLMSDFIYATFIFSIFIDRYPSCAVICFH